MKLSSRPTACSTLPHGVARRGLIVFSWAIGIVLTHKVPFPHGSTHATGSSRKMARTITEYNHARTAICNRYCWHVAKRKITDELHASIRSDTFRYLEAIDILYGSNTLCFRGAVGLLRFRLTLPEQNWQRLRKLNISTMFLVPVQEVRVLFPDVKFLPPEKYDAWDQACSMIGTLHYLQNLTIDFTIWNYFDWQNTNTIGHQDVFHILEPLQKIKANTILLELNAKVPETVRAVLEPLNFSIQESHRPYNGELFTRE
jgi:hypothetical protein